MLVRVREREGGRERDLLHSPARTLGRLACHNETLQRSHHVIYPHHQRRTPTPTSTFHALPRAALIGPQALVPFVITIIRPKRVCLCVCLSLWRELGAAAAGEARVEVAVGLEHAFDVDVARCEGWLD